MKCRKTDIPADSLVRQVLPAGYTDAFSCEVPGEMTYSVDDLQVSFWTVMPGWVNALFKLRNVLVKPFGLKGGEGDSTFQKMMEQTIRTGGSNGMTSVPFKNDRETVLKLSDKHLDAYASVYVRKDTPKPEVTVITVVHYHNRLGKVYFFFIKPFHKIIVKSTLKSTLKRLNKTE